MMVGEDSIDVKENCESVRRGMCVWLLQDKKVLRPALGHEAWLHRSVENLPWPNWVFPSVSLNFHYTS
jgi:hypothetical protein